MPKLSFSAILLTLTVTTAFAGEPFFEGSFEEACKLAEKNNKVVMLDFTAVWCGPCRMLDMHTWPDPKVKAWLNEHTIALKIDVDKNRPLTSQYRVRSYPTMVFLKPDGTEIGRTVGFQQPTTFIANSERVLSQPSDTARPNVPPVRQRPIARSNTNPPPQNPPSANAVLIERVKRARGLASEGRHEESLKELITCFDEALSDSTSSRLRLNVMLSEIINLGQQYPPALEALRERREHCRQTLFSRLGGDTKVWNSRLRHQMLNQALELAAMNTALGDGYRNRLLFHEIGEHEPLGVEIQRAMFDDLLDSFLATRSYQDLVDCAGDITDRIDQRIQRCRQVSAQHASATMRDDLDRYLRQQVAVEGGKFYEALLGVGRKSEAEDLANRVLEFDPSATAFATFIGHAVRAEAFDIARELVNRAEQSVRADDLTLVRRAAASIPKS